MSVVKLFFLVGKLLGVYSLNTWKGIQNTLHLFPRAPQSGTIAEELPHLRMLA